MKTILIILLSIFLTHCAGQNSNNSTDSQAAGSDVLTGTWQTSCLNNKRIMDTYTLDKTLDRVTGYYSDANCTTLLAKSELKRSYTTSNSQIDYTVTSMTYTIADQATVDECNTDSCFGFLDWKLNTAKDISGLSIDNASMPAPILGQKLYTIFKIDGNVLLYGDTTVKGYEGDTPDSRPDTYMQLVFMKQ